MERIFAGAFLLLVASAVEAQTMTCTMLTTGAVQVTHGTTTVGESMPPGVTGPAGHHTVQIGALFASARAAVTWHTTSTPAEVRFSLMHQLMAAGGATASATPGDLQLDVAVPPTMPLQLVMWREFSLAGGAPMPTVLIDVGDNGSAELDSATPAGVEVTVALPAGPSRIRVRALASLATPGMAAHVLHVRLRPAHTAVWEIGYGCDPPGLAVVPQFNGSLLLGHDGNATSLPWLVVLGANLAPTPLPGPWPLCLLLPTPDVVLFAPGVLQHTLAIPPTMRPLTLYAQNLRLSPFGTSSGSAFRLDAH